MSAGRLLLAQVSDSLSRSPDVHDAAADAPLAARRLPDRERRFTLPFRALPFAVNLYYFVVAERTSGGGASRQVVVLGAGPAGMSAAWRLSELGHPVIVLETRQRRRRHGQDDHGRPVLRRLRPAHVPHPRDRGEPRDPRGDPAVLRRRPADPDARHAGAAARQGIRLPARDAAGADRRQPAAVGADHLRLPRRDAEVDAGAAEERSTRSRSGASGISGARSTTCASGSIRSGSGGCRRRRFRRSRRSASPS